MRRALKRQRPLDFHGWRKEIKVLWYGLRLVARSDSSVRRDVRALRRAETLLGDDHNLVVLCEELSSDLSGCRSIDIDRLRLIADREQCRLREKAVERVRYIYDRGSGTYARAIMRAWNASRRHTKSERDRKHHRPAA
jgi:hypothetical protein